jgi:hypothetical protein
MFETEFEIKYPEISVQLVGLDGNAFSIMGRVKDALADAGVSKEDQSLYIEESMSGDYDELLRTACRWVNVS